MALIKCPECGREISDNASNCPGCGYTFTETKFCRHCGEKIAVDSVVCTKCGRQVEDMSSKNPHIIINNSSSASASSTASTSNSNYIRGKRKDKWVALILCIFLGFFGAHKFYEGKTGMGILYLFTMGLFGIGWIIDIISIAMKPNPYYV